MDILDFEGPETLFYRGSALECSESVETTWLKEARAETYERRKSSYQTSAWFCRSFFLGFWKQWCSCHFPRSTYLRVLIMPMSDERWVDSLPLVTFSPQRTSFTLVGASYGCGRELFGIHSRGCPSCSRMFISYLRALFTAYTLSWTSTRQVCLATTSVNCYTHIISSSCNGRLHCVYINPHCTRSES